jgi:hypothetical protein
MELFLDVSLDLIEVLKEELVEKTMNKRRREVITISKPKNKSKLASKLSFLLELNELIDAK